jgi:peptidoglycan/xylan/chitin deacetylase (PgdA/CDA1 family)
VSATAPAGFSKYVVSPQDLRRQMRWLALTGYETISLDRLVRAMAGVDTLPASPVVVTFDDGFEESSEHAAEALSAHGFTATFFIVAGLAGRTSQWLLKERGVERRLASWPRLRRLASSGFACGAHSLTHPRLTALASPACLHELADSRRILEQMLGRPVTHLAYPFGAYDARVRALALEAGYESACTVEIGLATPADDVMTLRRVPVCGGETLADFAWRLRTGHTLGDTYMRWKTRVRARVRA